MPRNTRHELSIRSASGGFPADLKEPSEILATKIRRHALRMVAEANSSHIGTCLSMADILAVLYNDVMRFDASRPDWLERDRFILSKGHGAAILYAVLAEKGFIGVEELGEFCQEGSLLTGHASHHVAGVEVSTGSLGHGLSLGCGMALAARSDGSGRRVFVLMGDGELNEGSNWEALMFAGHHGLDNLVAIIDCNKLQGFGRVEDILDLGPIADKLRLFRWAVREVDGHDHERLRETMAELPFEAGRPSLIVADTVKGKGVSFMENELAWHYKSPNAEQLAEALAELEGLQ